MEVPLLAAGCTIWGPTGKRVQKWRSGRTILWVKHQWPKSLRPMNPRLRSFHHLYPFINSSHLWTTKALDDNSQELKIVEAEDCEVDKIPVQEVQLYHFLWHDSCHRQSAVRKTSTMRPKPSSTFGISRCCTWSQEQVTGEGFMLKTPLWVSNLKVSRWLQV